MKLTLAKPIYHKGAVLLSGTELETSDTHARELLHKGYATQPQTTAKTPSAPPNKKPQAKPSGKAAKLQAGD